MTLIEMKCKIILLSIDQCTSHCTNVNQVRPATETLPTVFKNTIEGLHKANR